MQRITIALLFVVFAGDAFAQQPRKPAAPKPAAEFVRQQGLQAIQVRPNPPVIIEIPADVIQHKQVGKVIVAQPGRLVRPVIVGGVMPAPVPEVWGWGRGVRPQSPSTSQSLGKFAEAEIERMRQACALTDQQVRTLKIAAKGVVHRIKQQDKAERERVVRRLGGIQPAQVVVGFPLQTDNTRLYRQQLESQRIWQGAVKRVLTGEQTQRWSVVKSQPLVHIEPYHLPVVVPVIPPKP